MDLITEITSSAGNIAARLQHRQSFCETLRVLVTLYQKTNLCDQSLDHPSEHKDSKRRFIQTAVSSPSTESATRLPEAQPLEPLLRRFGLSPEALFESNEPSMSAYSLYEKMLNMHDCLRSLDIVADSMVASELARADSANQRLSSSVNSNSRFEITLSSVDQERQLSCLEARLGLAQRGTEYLDLDVLYQRDRTQGRFMDQWA